MDEELEIESSEIPGNYRIFECFEGNLSIFNQKLGCWTAQLWTGKKNWLWRSVKSSSGIMRPKRPAEPSAYPTVAMFHQGPLQNPVERFEIQRSDLEKYEFCEFLWLGMAITAPIYKSVRLCDRSEYVKYVKKRKFREKLTS